MILLFDIGNTHTHVGLANDRRVLRQISVPTGEWFGGNAKARIAELVGTNKIEGAGLCSVVPRATPFVRKFVAQFSRERRVPTGPKTSLQTRRQDASPPGAPGVPLLELTPKTLRGLGIDYPEPNTIGSDRLANAVAARHYFGAPVVVVDFGTAVTFDIVNRAGNYIGGIIAPGLAVMTDYLHEKTALLPKIRIREETAVVGKNTEQAMLIGAVHGYRGLVRELIAELRRELRTKRLPVVATGGYARLIASKLPQISAVKPNLTIEGLRLTWVATPAHGHR